MNNYKEIAGLITEDDLDTLVEETNGGVSEIVLLTIDIAVLITVSWDYCPTNGCTYSCRF